MQDSAIIEKNKIFGGSIFSLNSDGTLFDLIKIDAGGYRQPTSVDSLKEKVVDKYGNIRTDEHGHMKGGDVFNFVLREIPKNINYTVDHSKLKIKDFDYYIFHQANKFMNDYIVKKLKLKKDKVPSTISKYGNTSSVSIPITIVDQLRNKLSGEKKIFLCGFGVGMSWATAIINTHDLKISQVIEI